MPNVMTAETEAQVQAAARVLCCGDDECRMRSMAGRCCANEYTHQAHDVLMAAAVARLILSSPVTGGGGPEGRRGRAPVEVPRPLPSPSVASDATPPPITGEASLSERDARGPEEHERHRSGAVPADDLPYTPELLNRLALSLDDLWPGLGRTREVAERLLAHGIALVDPSRARAWIDERVYSGALFRLRLAEQPPSITFPQDLFI